MPAETPRGTAAGFKQYWVADIQSGFLVFLIALPLCLGISLACGYPAIAGIFTAIIGGLLATFFSNSELTIKGPAAGLIVIAIGCVTEFGFTAGRDPAADLQAYQLALGVGVAAGILQILIGVFRAGILGEFFPSAAVHGLLASIGVIIIAKQIPVVLGQSPEGAPLELLAKIPTFVADMHPTVGLIGIVSLVVMFVYPFLKVPVIRSIPAPLVVLVIAVPLGFHFELGQEFLVNVPRNMFGALTFPDFSGIATATGVKYIISFALVGSLESLLSAKAVDEIDPCHRKTNYDSDLLAVGVGNTLAALVGGLPMISEIVRSKATIDNGAKTRFANMYHGIFLLLFVALAPMVVNQIPLAALGAMLVFTGFRLGFASRVRPYISAVPPAIHHLRGDDHRRGWQPDLLVGIAIGILVKALLHLWNGLPLAALFRLRAEVATSGDRATIAVKDGAVFSTWIALKKRLEALKGHSQVTVDLSDTRVGRPHGDGAAARDGQGIRTTRFQSRNLRAGVPLGDVRSSHGRPDQETLKIVVGPDLCRGNATPKCGMRSWVLPRRLPRSGRCARSPIGIRFADMRTCRSTRRFGKARACSAVPDIWPTANIANSTGEAESPTRP